MCVQSGRLFGGENGGRWENIGWDGMGWLMVNPILGNRPNARQLGWGLMRMSLLLFSNGKVSFVPSPSSSTPSRVPSH